MKRLGETAEYYLYDDETGSVKFVYPNHVAYYLHNNVTKDGVSCDRYANFKFYMHDKVIYQYEGSKTDHQRLQWVDDMVEHGVGLKRKNET